MSLGISSRVQPTASLAAILAIGKPVAFEARALLRETLGFISTTIISPFSGLTANCTFEPPVSTPISRMIAIDAFLITWYSLSLKVWIGATVMLSPVCMPIGSRFSMEHTITTLSLLSRITSSSYSFQPNTDSSSITCPIKLASNPALDIFSSSSGLYATPPPVPPRVKLGRTIIGNPISSAMAATLTISVAMPLFGMRSPILSIALRKRFLSSAFFMDSMDAPIISTLNLSNTPILAVSTAVLSPVCPPRVGSSASGRSLSIIFATVSGVTGSMYVRSAVSGSVMIVAGLLLTSTTS